MLFFTVIVALMTGTVQGDLSYDDCKARNFEPKACWNSKQLFKAGTYLCKIQGKKLANRSDCVEIETEIAAK